MLTVKLWVQSLMPLYNLVSLWQHHVVVIAPSNQRGQKYSFSPPCKSFPVTYLRLDLKSSHCCCPTAGAESIPRSEVKESRMGHPVVWNKEQGAPQLQFHSSIQMMNTNHRRFILLHFTVLIGRIFVKKIVLILCSSVSIELMNRVKLVWILSQIFQSPNLKYFPVTCNNSLLFQSFFTT